MRPHRKEEALAGGAGKLIRVSAARAKVRSGYTAASKVCISGFAAGVVLFLVSVGVYFSLTLARSWTAAGNGFDEGFGVISGFFGAKWFGKANESGAIVNLALIGLVFGGAGAAAGAILRYTIRKEPSDQFFRRKVRLPWDLFPFLFFFLCAGLMEVHLLAVYFAAAIIAGCLWRFWFRVVLSVVSSLDVNRYIPKPS